MKKCKMVYLVLHFETIDETIKCIESIRAKDDTEGNYHVVVVDNASKNGSGAKLLDMYVQDEHITVILNDRNLGFSGGNNIGFHYIKEHFDPDFIMMMNNDTELLQSDYYRSISEEYKRSHFAVLGPEIILKDGSVCKDPKQIIKLDEIDREKKRTKKELLKNYLMIESIHLVLYKYLHRLRIWQRIKEKHHEPIINDPYMENVRLHGCCLIFSPVYIEKFDGLDNRTFLYAEEEILFVRLIVHNMKSVYDPQIKIYHAERAATGAVFGDIGYKKRRFVYQKHLEVLKVIEELYQENFEALKEYIL